MLNYSLKRLLLIQRSYRRRCCASKGLHVRNSGAISEATLISIRCQTGSTLVGIMSIPMLQSNELGMVTCDWKTTENGPQTLSVEIDRSNQILESDEENNFASVTIDVAKYTTEDSSSDTIDFNKYAMDNYTCCCSIDCCSFFSVCPR